MELQGPKETADQQDPRETRVSKASQEIQVNLVPMERREIRDHKAQEVLLDPKEKRVHLDHSDLRDPEECLEHLANLVWRERKETLVTQDQGVTGDLQDLLDHQDLQEETLLDSCLNMAWEDILDRGDGVDVQLMRMMSRLMMIWVTTSTFPMLIMLMAWRK